MCRKGIGRRIKMISIRTRDERHQRFPDRISHNFTHHPHGSSIVLGRKWLPETIEPRSVKSRVFYPEATSLDCQHHNESFVDTGFKIPQSIISKDIEIPIGAESSHRYVIFRCLQNAPSQIRKQIFLPPAVESQQPECQQTIKDATID